MAICIIDLEFRPDGLSKLSGKHHVTEDDVRALLQWPARPRVAFDTDPEHGPRWVALVVLAGGAEFFAALLPVPWYDGDSATRWELVTAYWL